MSGMITVGLDLAKSVFQVYGRDIEQKTLFNKQLKRKDVVSFFAALPPCHVGVEACGSAHYWARALKALGHTVKLMPPKYVKGYLKRGKTDATDAEAICEAASRAHVTEVPAKSEAQQCALMLHKARETLIRQRTLMANTIRAHMAELGVIDAAGGEGMKRLLALLNDDANPVLSASAQAALRPLALTFAAICVSISKLDAAISRAHRHDETSRRLETIPGVGRMAATAFAAGVGHAAAFKSARHFAASLGLTPKLDGTGGKVRLGSITKQGNGYLRRLLYLGAVAVLSNAQRKPGKASAWMLRLLAEKPFKTAVIALANKMARTIWALLVRGGTYDAKHQPAVQAARQLAWQ